MKKTTSGLRTLSFVLAFIGIALVVRRILALNGLLTGFGPPGDRSMDDDFAPHAVITLIHILPGAGFMILGPLQFLPRIRQRYPRFHRRSGRIFLLCGAVIGVTAGIMPFVLTPIGGVNETVGVLLFAAYFLIALGKAFGHILHHRVALHREWMIRAFSVGLAVVTVRPIVALFFIFSRLSPHVFFGTAFWLGFSLHAIAAEVWINYTRKSLALA
ncbi:DUF2306 domain-containing protein [Puia sp.]|jgi:hypothetical protein|uniref:DUF2306 domain-containing protein n=1 Tax=Puia sp. TaxID=2045100 RepID=UPI002F3E4EDA